MQNCKLINHHILCKHIVAIGIDCPDEHPDYLTREMPDGQHVLIKQCVFSGEYCSVTDPKYKLERVPKIKDEQERNDDPEPSLLSEMKI